MSIKNILFTSLLIIQVISLPAETTAAPLTVDERHELVNRIVTLISENYVDPSMGEAVIGELQRAVKAGVISDKNDPLDIATALTGVLQAMDRHFRINWSTEAYSNSHEDSDALAEWESYSRRQNFGFRSVEVRPGNIGYLHLRYFESMGMAKTTAVAAMALLANTNAVIVDLRHNGGGEPDMVQFLCSYFFDSTPVHLNSLYWRPGNRLQEFWTLAELPGKRLPEVPLFVITSRRTGSAAEEFAYNMKSLGRATLVGETTVGAANPGDNFEVGNGFSMFISTGKAINPVTGSNWEGVGVTPDVEVNSDIALQAAEELALKQLLTIASDAVQRKAVRWATEALLAKKTQATLSKKSMDDYAGQYGDRLVFIKHDSLYYRRGKRQAYKMLRVDGDTFILDGKEGFKTRFERDETGTIVRMVDKWLEGHQSANTRL